MIIANFINKQDALVTGLDQYDYGQVLRIQGLNLPTAVEIHFGLEETGGTTTTRIGVTKDGVTDVPIPDSMLENGDISLDYTIYAFIYLTDDTSGKTVHRIRMQVKARSKPELLNKPEDKELFQKAIEAVNQSAKEAEGWAHGREDMPERATDNAKYYAGESAKSAESVKGVEQNVKDMVATIGGIEQQVQDVKTYAGQAQSASEKALLSEQEAKKSEGAALQHRTGAETAENNAELAESNAKKSEQAVERAKQLVMQMGQEVLQNKNQVDGKVETFNKVVTDAVDAVGAVKTDAVGAVETKGTEQVKMVSDEGAKQVKAVEGKGQEVLQSIPEDFTTQMQSKLDKNQGAENKDKILGIGANGLVVPVDKPSVESDYELLVDTTITQQTKMHQFELSKPCKDVIVFVDFGDGAYLSDYRLIIFGDFFITARNSTGMRIHSKKINNTMAEVDGIAITNDIEKMYGKTITRRYTNVIPPTEAITIVKSYHYFGLNAKVKIWGR